MAGGRRIRAFTSSKDRASNLAGEYTPTGPPLPVSPATPAGTLATSVRSSLRYADEYALRTWYPDTYGSQGAVDVLSLGGTDHDAIRPPASSALGLAISVATGAYDAAVTGSSEADAKTIAVRLARSVAAAHKSNKSSGGWGYDWQPSLWAFNAGLAGWLLWGELSSGDKTTIANMVGREADWRVTRLPEYWKDTDGDVNSGRSGDTAAEENSWNIGVCLLAWSMMPTHRNRTAWMDCAVRLSISSFSAEADLDDTSAVNGTTPAASLNGFNTENNGTLYNQSKLHPDYMATVLQNIAAGLCPPLAGKKMPQAVTWGVARTWGANRSVTFSAPPYDEPGGTMYVTDSGTLYYPDGSSWGTLRYADKTAADVLVSVAGVASGLDWALLHINEQIDLQERHADGKTYTGSGEDSYAGREQWVHYLTAFAWLGLWMDANDMIALSNASPGSSFDA